MHNFGLSFLIALVLLGSAIGVVFGHWRRSVHQRKVYLPWTLVALTVLTLLFGIVGWGEYKRYFVQYESEQLAGFLTGTKGQIRVDCQRVEQAFFDIGVEAGWVSYDDPKTIHLKRDTCLDLFGYLKLADKGAASVKQISALTVLVHEVAHTQGYWDESVAQCLALTHLHVAAHHLGATHVAGADAVKQYLVHVQPFLPKQYKLSAQCPALDPTYIPQFSVPSLLGDGLSATQIFETIMDGQPELFE